LFLIWIARIFFRARGGLHQFLQGAIVTDPTMRAFIGAISIVFLAACSQSDSKQAAATNSADSTAHLAHEAYTSAINSNNLDSLSGMFTDDVVFLAAHSAPIVGKAAVRAWAKDYLDAFTTHWEKTTQEFQVSGDWAFERYSYKSTDTPKTGGAAVEDTGWGLVVYHHDADGKWRVARDAFSTDKPIPTK
jgi:ketosteroid isomerase-like protein